MRYGWVAVEDELRRNGIAGRLILLFFWAWDGVPWSDAEWAAEDYMTL